MLKKEKNQKEATMSEAKEVQNMQMETLKAKEMKKTAKDLTNEEEYWDVWILKNKYH